MQTAIRENIDGGWCWAWAWCRELEFVVDKWPLDVHECLSGIQRLPLGNVTLDAQDDLVHVDVFRYFVQINTSCTTLTTWCQYNNGKVLRLVIMA